VAEPTPKPNGGGSFDISGWSNHPKGSWWWFGHPRSGLGMTKPFLHNFFFF
jgi:hypothetical protein